MATIEIQTETGPVAVPVDALYEAVERRKDEHRKEVRKEQNRIYYLQTREARLAADRARRLAAKVERLAAKAEAKATLKTAIKAVAKAAADADRSAQDDALTQILH